MTLENTIKNYQDDQSHLGEYFEYFYLVSGTY